MSRHAAQPAVLLLPVLKQHIAARQVGRVEVVEQETPLRVYLPFSGIVAADAPLAHKAHGAHLPAYLLEAHDVLAP